MAPLTGSMSVPGRLQLVVDAVEDRTHRQEGHLRRCGAGGDGAAFHFDDDRAATPPPRAFPRWWRGPSRCTAAAPRRCAARRRRPLAAPVRAPAAVVSALSSPVARRWRSPIVRSPGCSSGASPPAQPVETINWNACAPPSASIAAAARCTPTPVFTTHTSRCGARPCQPVNAPSRTRRTCRNGSKYGAALPLQSREDGDSFHAPGIIVETPISGTPRESERPAASTGERSVPCELRTAGRARRPAAAHASTSAHESLSGQRPRGRR